MFDDSADQCFDTFKRMENFTAAAQNPRASGSIYTFRFELVHKGVHLKGASKAV